MNSKIQITANIVLQSHLIGVTAASTALVLLPNFPSHVIGANNKAVNF